MPDILRHGQTNFLKSLFKFNSVYDPAKLLADHDLPVHYELELPVASAALRRAELYVHVSQGRRERALDEGTERFVTETGGTDLAG